jgi:hypothetical protein
LLAGGRTKEHSSDDERHGYRTKRSQNVHRHLRIGRCALWWPGSELSLFDRR